MHIAKTSDVLYTNDSTYFLMDRSPLEKFPGYKELYDGKAEPYGKVNVMFGGLIPPDTTTNYMVDWYLNDEEIARKLYFSTDLEMAAVKIVSYHRPRFQIEFLHRDASSSVDWPLDGREVGNKFSQN